MERRLGPRKGQAVVGGADDERVLREPLGVQGVEHGADAAVQRAGALLERCHVQARLRGVRQVRGRYDVVRLLGGGGAEELAVGLEEADGEEEGTVARLFEQVEGHGDHVVGAGRGDLEDFVVADHAGLLAYVLLPDKRRPVPVLA